MSDQNENEQQAPKKQLMPELLPRPVSFEGTATRARVIAHLRLLAATGAATLTLAACPFIAVDPLPPPPNCRTTRGVAGDLSGSVTMNGSVNDGGMYVDGGIRRRFSLVLTPTGNAAFSGAIALTALIRSTNTNDARIESGTGESMTVSFEPTDLSLPVELRFATSCEGSAAVVLSATLTPAGSGTYTVTLADVP